MVVYLLRKTIFWRSNLSKVIDCNASESINRFVTL
jgi:hypothetical protein